MPDSPKAQPAQTKPCPICGEPIKSSAKKCIHCNEFLEGHTGWRWANWLELKPRTIWDLMGLLVVPVALACCGLGFGLYQQVREENIQQATAVFLYRDGQQKAAATDAAARATDAARATERVAVGTQAAQTAVALVEEKRIAQAQQTAAAKAVADAQMAQATIDAAQNDRARATAVAQATAQAALAQATAEAAAAQATAEAIVAAQTAAVVQAAQTAEAINAQAIRDAEVRATGDALSGAQLVEVAPAENKEAAATQAATRAVAAQATAEAAVAQATADAQAVTQTAVAQATAQAVQELATAEALQARAVLVIVDEANRFRIDRTEVTNQGYRECVADGACGDENIADNNPYYADEDDYPVVGVSWRQAQEYCEWTGGRLPTLDEWQAAVSPEGWKYPWGDEPDPAWGDVDPACEQAILRHCDNGRSRPFVVGSRPLGASRDGVLDLIGNVWEWTATQGGDGARVTVGGSWSNPAGDPPDGREVQTFTPPNAPVQGETRQADNLGFRCVWDSE